MGQASVEEMRRQCCVLTLLRTPCRSSFTVSILLRFPIVCLDEISPLSTTQGPFPLILEIKSTALSQMQHAQVQTV